MNPFSAQFWADNAIRPEHVRETIHTPNAVAMGELRADLQVLKEKIERIRRQHAMDMHNSQIVQQELIKTLQVKDEIDLLVSALMQASRNSRKRLDALEQKVDDLYARASKLPPCPPPTHVPNHSTKLFR